MPSRDMELADLVRVRDLSFPHRPITISVLAHIQQGGLVCIMVTNRVPRRAEERWLPTSLLSRAALPSKLISQPTDRPTQGDLSSSEHPHTVRRK